MQTPAAEPVPVASVSPTPPAPEPRRSAGPNDDMSRQSDAQASMGQLERRRTVSVRAFYAAGVALAVGAFLPWAEVLGLAGISPSGGLVVYLLAFAGVYAGEGYLVKAGRVTRGLLIGAWVINAWMLINLILIFNSLGQSDGLVTPGSGVYVASIGILAGIFATVQLHRSRRPGSIAPVADEHL